MGDGRQSSRSIVCIRLLILSSMGICHWRNGVNSTTRRHVCEIVSWLSVEPAGRYEEREADGRGDFEGAYRSRLRGRRWPLGPEKCTYLACTVCIGAALLQDRTTNRRTPCFAAVDKKSQGNRIASWTRGKWYEAVNLDAWESRQGPISNEAKPLSCAMTHFLCSYLNV